MLSRRSVLKFLALLSCRFAPNTLQALGESAPVISYMDGYHGGIVGHMPPGSWRDILSALDQFPSWKINLDIEASSWEVLRRDDPEAFARLASLLADTSPSARVEMVGGTFAQPYGWAISGESNIRQLQRGLEVIRASFPDLPVVTYAVQEPCWASCLPQILRSLGFDGASLKDASTAWGGYMAGYNADAVRWTGPDGTAIAAVPRYAVERLQHVWETESIDATEEFAERCRHNGIEHPAGMCFQDLGWTAKPRVQGSRVRYLTWREYIHRVLPPPEASWRVSIEDILVTLPWGDPTLRTVAQQVRSAENQIVIAEKMASLAYALRRAPYPAEALNTAWDKLLLSQAHDAWITATTRKGRQAWAFDVAANTLESETMADEIIAQASDALTQDVKSVSESPLGLQQARLFNTLAFPRTEIVVIPLSTDPGTTSVVVEDEHGNSLPAQAIVDRSYYALPVLDDMSQKHAIAPEGTKRPDGGVNHEHLLVRASIPPMGFRTLKLTPLYGKAALPPQPQGVSVRHQEDGSVVLASDLYELQIDPSRGGTIRSLRSLKSGKEFVDAGSPRRFGEYRGYFIEDRAWYSSADAAATIIVEEEGPVRAAVRVNVTMGSTQVSTLIQVATGEPRIDVSVTLYFPQPTWIGDPYEPAPTAHMSDPRRSQNDGRWKLQVHLPFVQNGSLFKSAAFDVCRSNVKDTSFQSWDDIKHNIITQWIDLAQPDEAFGLAVLSDRTTAYNFGPDQPLGLVLGWAWDGSFWWGKHPFEGEHTTRFAFLPHAQSWDRAKVAYEYSRFCEPLLAALVQAPASTPPLSHSLVSTADPGLQLSAMRVVSGSIEIRLFNAESEREDHSIRLGFRPQKVEIVDLNGRSIEPLSLRPNDDESCTLSVKLRRFGLCTLRCHI